jgi:guanylate kinase
LAKAQEEMRKKDKFDAIILNNSLEKAVEDVLYKVTKFLH